MVMEQQSRRTWSPAAGPTERSTPPKRGRRVRLYVENVLYNVTRIIGRKSKGLQLMSQL